MDENETRLIKKDKVVTELQSKFDNITHEFECMLSLLNHLLEKNVTLAFPYPITFLFFLICLLIRCHQEVTLQILVS